MRPFVLWLALIAVWPTASNAEIDWRMSARPPASLEGRSTESESDASFRAVCRNKRTVEVRVGAEEQVGKGRGELVKLQFASSGRSAIIQGVSKKSADFEMTGGTELVANVTPNHPVFAVLMTGKPVSLSGSVARRATWTSNNMRAAVEKFLRACRRA